MSYNKRIVYLQVSSVRVGYYLRNWL